MSEREAPRELGLIQAFVNTVDLGDGPEELQDPNTLKAWLVARGMLDESREVDPADLKHAIAVREAVRAVIGANSGYPVYPVDVATLNGAVSASRLRVRFGPDGKPRIEPEEAGVVGALGRIVAALEEAMKDADWPRLKLCGDPTCRWAFYDHSRNHSSRWCDMATCGNRQKARRFRSRSKAPADRPVG
jgi:predicted RNA-binding Zn ribbon-like protein